MSSQHSIEAQTAVATIPQIKYENGSAYLLVEFLDDDLVHFESGSGGGPSDEAAIDTTPMVAKTDYAGPTAFNDDGQGTLTTAELQVIVDGQTLCSTVIDLVREVELTAVCPQDLDQRKKVLTIDPQSMQAVYGLGEEFRAPGEPNGDWVGSRRTPGVVGNEMEGYSGGAVGNAQFPIMYALGDGFDNYALFVDAVYKQEWDFTGAPWTMTTAADPLRWYVFTGPDLPDLRADYLELTGRPPVPPKPLFGLWVSEYGYDDWAELDDKRQTLDENQFPQDGFVLDLQWFGGIQTPSQMGSLSWDLTNFPDPAAKIAKLQTEEGLELILIEESYVDQGLSNFGRMASQSYLVKSCETCGPVIFQAKWWGTGGMVDWTNEDAAALWHDMNRQPLVDIGVLGHWTDLGEPEMFAPNDWYAGLSGLDLHDEAANHNLYNLKWAESIDQGYARNEVTQRPAILSRSGTTGIQRYGAAMWSADIGSNFDSLAAQMNAQMQMSFSGIDYFGSDIGGFHRGNISGADLDELYTVWLANSALLDVPVRPHTENLCNCKETAPDRIGDLASNLANIRLRYSLSPYLYSLAHRAYLAGEPIVPPLVFYFQEDANTRELGDHKLLGADLLVRTVTEPGVTAVPVYLPAGQWVDFYSGAWIDSAGGWLEDVPVVDGDLFRLPLFLRAGAIVPRMAVDEQT
ncbi:MAG: glycoside hydrolase family 31 protein, partial [Anaerolineae bacterium]